MSSKKLLNVTDYGFYTKDDIKNFNDNKINLLDIGRFRLIPPPINRVVDPKKVKKIYEDIVKDPDTVSRLHLVVAEDELQRLIVIDGQHRFFAIRRAFSEKVVPPENREIGVLVVPIPDNKSIEEVIREFNKNQSAWNVGNKLDNIARRFEMTGDVLGTKLIRAMKQVSSLFGEVKNRKTKWYSREAFYLITGYPSATDGNRYNEFTRDPAVFVAKYKITESSISDGVKEATKFLSFVKDLQEKLDGKKSRVTFGDRYSLFALKKIHDYFVSIQRDGVRFDTTLANYIASKIVNWEREKDVDLRFVNNVNENVDKLIVALNYNTKSEDKKVPYSVI